MQRRDVFDGDLIRENFNLVIRADVAAARGFRVKREDGDFAAEQLLQAFDETPLPLSGFLRGLPAVFAVHVENKIDRFVLMNQAAQHEPRQEGFARAGFAENAVAALHKAVKIQADRRVHVERRAEIEKFVVRAAFAAENPADILFLRVEHIRKMGGNGFDRQNLSPIPLS